MQRLRTLSVATIVALIASLLLTAVAGANPPAPGDRTAQPPVENQTGTSVIKPVKPLDRPNIKDFQRNKERQRLLANGQYLEAQSLALNADDRVLVILVEFGGSDTFTWKPGDKWDPIGKADPNEAVYDPDGSVVVGDCSNIITQTKTFTYSGPVHNQIPRPLSEADRSGQSIWTEDFSKGWFEAFMFGNGVKFQYTRQDGSVVNEDFTGESVKNYYLDMSGGEYEIAGDVVGWVQVPHSTWYYGAERCPGNRSGMSSGSGADNGIPGAGNPGTLVKDALTAVNAISNTIPGFDWHNYDRDGDGIIDRLWIVHAGYGEEDGTDLLNLTNYSEASIWSHSGGITPFKVAPDLAAGPYIIMPENGGIGVFAHEYAHNLGAQDLYAYSGGQTSAGFWALQADDWTGYPIGYEPPAVDAMHLDRWGWLNPKVISDPTQTYTFKLGQASNFPGGQGVYRGAKIELPKGVAPLAAPVWQGKYYWWGGKEDEATGSMTTKNAVAVPASGATLSFDTAYGIEAQWDFMWVQASEDGKNWKTLTNANTTCEHDPSWIGGTYGFPEDLCAAGIGGFTDYNASFPEPDTETFDLSAFAGKSVWLRLWYMTDWGTTYEGPFIDNIEVKAGDTVLFADEAEADGKWTYVAPWQRSDGTLTFGQRFYLQWRNVSATGGYDSSLGDSRWRYGPANTGMIVWYNNDFYSDNEIYNYLQGFPSFGPKGVSLVVDANPLPYRDPALQEDYPNAISNLPSRSMMRDAPFSLKKSVDFVYPALIGTSYTGRPAVSSFHDAFGYYPGVEYARRGKLPCTTTQWYDQMWDASAVVPAKTLYSTKATGGTSFISTTGIRMRGFANPTSACGAGWYGFWYVPWSTPANTGNPGDELAQYGWHVQILSQSDSVATVKVWNSMKDVQGAVTQTPSSTPVVKGDTVKVDVKVTNNGSLINGLFIAPLDAEEQYVDGSAYGGAFPITAAMAQEMAEKAGIAEIDGLPEGADAGAVVAVALTATPATGETVNFGFSTTVTADSGLLHHTVTIFDSSTLLVTLESSSLMIGAASQLYLPVIAR